MHKAICLLLLTTCFCGCATTKRCENEATNQSTEVIIPSINEYLKRRGDIVPIDSHGLATLASLYAGCTYGDWYLLIPEYTPEHEEFLKDISRYVVSLRIERITGFDHPNDALRALQYTTALRTLDIEDLPISGDGLKDLWGLPHVKTLILSNTLVGDEDIGTLMLIEPLRKIKVDQTRLTAEGIQEIRERAPEIEILK